MPVPLVALAYLVPGLLAAGGAAWEWLRPERDPEWADKAVFNDRMRTIQSNILDLNKALNHCPAFGKDVASKAAWKNYMTNWSAYYREVGKKEYFDPSPPQIANAKLYASQFNHWIEVLKGYRECVTFAPPSGSTLPPPAPPDDTPVWLVPALIGALGALYLASRK